MQMGLGAQRLELGGVLDIGIERVHGAHGVADGAFEVGTALVERLGAIDDVAHVVERVEHAEDVDAVTMGRLDEAIDDIAGIMVVANEILAAREHLQRRVGTALLDDAQAVPGILVEEAQAGIEGRATPHLDRPIADLVELRQDGEHVARLHARCPQRLMRVAQGRVP